MNTYFSKVNSLCFGILTLICVSPLVQASPVLDQLNPNDYQDEYVQEFLKPEAMPAPVSGQGVLLFINMNLNPKEALSAKKIAKAKGLRLVSFPNNELFAKVYPFYDQFMTHEERAAALDHRMDVLKDLQERSKSQAKKDLIQKQIDLIYKKRLALKDNYDRVDLFNRARKAALEYFHVDSGNDEYSLSTICTRAYTQALYQMIGDLVTSGSKVDTLILSGHHGNSFFGEVTFSLSMPEFRARVLPFAQDLHLIALWGCDTINDWDLKEWVAAAPNVLGILGYSDTAPIGTGSDSAEYLVNGVLSVPSLLEARSPAEFKRMMLRIPGVSETAAAAMICTKRLGSLVFNSNIVDQDGSRGLSRSVDTLESEDRCTQFKHNLNSIMEEVRPYYQGKKSIPRDETYSPIKLAYFELHHDFDCYTPDYYQNLDVYQVGLLRFYETDVKFNIAVSLKDLMLQSEAELGARPQATLPAAFQGLRWAPLFTDLTREQMVPKIRLLNDVNAFDKALFPKTILMLSYAMRLGVNLDSRCMEFDVWHSKSEAALPISCEAQ